MERQARTRNDPRRDATRIALIEAAESLFAESGVDGVSTRQIGAAIGSANTNVVAYHFGSKEALIEAVYRHRLPAIDRRRRVLLDAADAAGRGNDLDTLVRVFALPLFEQVDAKGCHSYARFIAGLERSGLAALRGRVAAEFPETERLTARIGACLPANAQGLVHFRMRLMAGLISAALLMIDRETTSPAQAEALFANALAMAAAALCARGVAEIPDEGQY